MILEQKHKFLTSTDLFTWLYKMCVTTKEGIEGGVHILVDTRLQTKQWEKNKEMLDFSTLNISEKIELNFSEL